MRIHVSCIIVNLYPNCPCSGPHFSPRDASPCPSEAAARPSSSSPQPCYTMGPAQQGISRPVLGQPSGRCMVLGLGLPQWPQLLVGCWNGPRMPGCALINPMGTTSGPGPKGVTGLTVPWYLDPCLLLCCGSVYSRETSLYLFITFTNGINAIGFMFNDQSYFEWNLADKIFRFCLLALD